MEVRGEDNKWWRFTGIYGESSPELKFLTWELLRDLFVQHERNSMPWLCAGDFNEILFHHEKEGGIPMSQSYLDHFIGIL